MRTLALLTLAFLPFSLAACGGNTHEALADQTITHFKTIVSTLDGVKDKASWDAAKPALDKVMTALEGIGKKMKDMDEPDEETKKKLNEKMGKEMSSVMSKLMASGQKFAKMPDVAQDFGKFMQDMGKRMDAMK